MARVGEHVSTSMTSPPSSQSTGSLQDPLAMTSNTAPTCLIPQPRPSNPIISSEEDHDKDDFLDGELKLGGSVDDFMSLAALSASSAAAVPLPQSASLGSLQNDVADTAAAAEYPHQQLMSNMGNVSNGYPQQQLTAHVGNPTVTASASFEAMNIATSKSVEMNIANSKSVEMSLGDASGILLGYMESGGTSGGAPGGIPPPLTSRSASLSAEHSIRRQPSYIPQALSNSSVAVSDLPSPASTQPSYIPPTLSNFSSAITPNNTLVSITPTSTIITNHSNPTPTSVIAKPPPSSNNHLSKDSSNNNFDFDATRHNRRRGTGYLASQLSLSTPTDVFAAGCTLLQLCAIGDLPSVKEYISTRFNNVNFRDYDRRTALHVASSEGHLDVVKYLVNKGANVNRSDRWGGSPLDDAHRHRHTGVARYLRSRGARTGSLNLTSNLIAAAAAGDIEEVRMICGTDDMGKMSMDLSGRRSRHKAQGVGEGVLDMSSTRGRVEQGSSLLDISEPTVTGIDSVDINNGDYDKRTALHLAAGEGHLDVVQFLIKRGADVNARDRWGGKPLDDALHKGNEMVAEVLRKHGAIASGDDDDCGSCRFANHHSSRSLVTALSGHESELRPEDENLRVDFSELEMIERIGSGAFGEIYKCRWRGILVAAKCIKASKIQKEWLLKNRWAMTDKDRIANRIESISQTAITDEEKQLALEDFRRETAIMRRLRHPNIVMMLAYSHTQDVEVMISEICRCSLLDVFKANNISNSRIPKRTQIVYAQQLAQGMNHLHKSRPPIIHRDLKPANLLIDFSGMLKIADFGLAKIRPNPEQNESGAFMMTGETGSYRFMAPEVFRHEKYRETVDVYSYAMIFYYLLRGTPPWAGLSGLDAVTKAAVDGERPSIPRNVDERLSILLKSCWDEDSRARPSFEEIITCLNVYSHDVFKTSDKEVQMTTSNRDGRCAGCVVS